MYCKKCGAQIPDGNRYCSVCGTSIAEDIASGQVNLINNGEENYKGTRRISIISIVIIMAAVIIVISSVTIGIIAGITHDFNKDNTVEEAEIEETLDIDESEILASFKGGYVTKDEYLVYYEMFSDYLKAYGYDSESIPMEILYKATQDKIIKTLAENAGVKLSRADRREVDEIFSNDEYIEYFSTNYSFDLDLLKEIYYSDYLIEDYVKKLEEELTDEEVFDYIKKEYPDITDFNGYETQHILLSTQTSSGTEMTQAEKDAVKQKAIGLLNRIKNGENFDDLAKEYSDDEGTAQDGGKYTMYMNGSTVDEYVEAVKTLSEGELYDGIVETEYGYHIIRLNKIVSNGIIDFEEYREDIVNDDFDALLDSSEYDVKYYEENLEDFLKEIQY